MKKDLKLIELAKYLIGLTAKSNHGIVWDYNRKSCFPVVVSPMAEYLHEINRFMFDGGLNVDVDQADEKDPRQKFLETIVDKNKLQSSLESIWETGAITGELLVVLRLTSQGYYSFEWFDSTEFEAYYEESDLSIVEIKARRNIDDKVYIYRMEFTPEAYIEYPLVEERYERTFNWEAAANPVLHNYKMVPGQVIRNKVSINKSCGIPEFNFAACRMAAATMMTTFDSVENIHFFGSPLLASPDPDDTLTRLKKKIQVLSKESGEQGGQVDVLNFDAIQDTHLEIIDKLKANFNSFMGIKVGDSGIKADVSSLTLRILNAATISKAESRWQNYVEDGLTPVFEKCLQMAAVDGMLAMVNLAKPETYKVVITRKKPYFVESPVEKTQLLDVAQRLVDLGVDRVVALKETIWPNLTEDQIREKLRINLEDEVPPPGPIPGTQGPQPIPVTNEESEDDNEED